MKTNHKIIGILGGMGSLSSLFLHEKILSTAVLMKQMSCDADYPDIIHFSLPTGIPDRSDFLLGKAVSNPAFIVYDFLISLQHVCDVLHRDMIAVVACNTFHAPPIWDVLTHMRTEKPLKNVTLGHFVEIVGQEYIKEFHEDKIGVLSTSGERKFDIYKNMLSKQGVTCFQTTEAEQEDLQKSIYNIKKNPIPQPEDLRTIHKILETFSRQGVHNVILGCTELSMIKNHITWQGALIDPIEILSKKFIQITGEDPSCYP